MSITHEVVVSCPCGTPIVVTVAESLNAGRHPHLRTALLEGKLHRYNCAACGKDSVVDSKLFYFDANRGHAFFVYPRARRRELAQCLVETKEAFDASIGAPELGSLMREVMVRVCFGFEELREKVVCDDAKLSDFALEVLKLEVLAAMPELRERGVVSLSLRTATDTELGFVPERADGERAPQITVERARYAEVAARGHDELKAAWPGIAHGPHVNMLGLIA